MKERKRNNKKNCIFKAIVCFVLVIGFIIAAGILLPDQLVKLTNSNSVVTERTLIPGGQSVGIEMSVRGALIVGVENNIGPQVGDMIISVNGETIKTPNDVSAIVGNSGEMVTIEVMRNNRKFTYDITPYLDTKSNQYKLGFWIKDKIAGIGTMSFYDPSKNVIACLGHGIYETETGSLLETEKGNLLNTKVINIKEGKQGEPGEIGGTIYNFENPLGKIEKNTEFGIYAIGNEEQSFRNREPMVMATHDQIKTGKAYILTTVDGTKVEKFNIEITRVHNQRVADVKGLEFEVTDEHLINTCGGIVQGMSGSPIIQNNRIIGAVTHVFINNPKKGYGVFAEWMVKEIDK